MMATIEITSLIQSIVNLLTEAYAGPPDPSSTWFLDNEPDSGILGLLKGVTAEEASTPAGESGDPGTTIASHVEHLRWSLANANRAMRGEGYQPNWSESWRLLNADDAAWETLRQALREEYETLRGAIQKQETLEGDYLNGVLAMTTHAAFHLGLMRQMLERVRAKNRGR